MIFSCAHDTSIYYDLFISWIGKFQKLLESLNKVLDSYERNIAWITVLCLQFISGLYNFFQERKPLCPHPCPRPCHPGDCSPCKALIKRSCHCGSMVHVFECTYYNNLPEKEQQTVRSCGGPCHRYHRFFLLYSYFLPFNLLVF